MMEFDISLDEVAGVITISNLPGPDGYMCAHDVSSKSPDKVVRQVYEYLSERLLAIHEQSTLTPEARGGRRLKTRKELNSELIEETSAEVEVRARE